MSMFSMHVAKSDPFATVASKAYLKRPQIDKSSHGSKGAVSERATCVLGCWGFKAWDYGPYRFSTTRSISWMPAASAAAACSLLPRTAMMPPWTLEQQKPDPREENKVSPS
jgi:hypothetical protein